MVDAHQGSRVSGYVWAFIMFVAGAALSACLHEEHFAPNSTCPAYSTETPDGCVCDDGYRYNGAFCIPEGDTADVGAGDDVEREVTCTSREMCPVGEACLAGNCGVNTTGFCATRDECPRTMYCADDHVCVTGSECAIGCPDGMTCDGTDCVSSGDLCVPCDTDAQCGGVGTCSLVVAGRTFCTRPCDDDAPCPSGFSCSESLCVPLGPHCDGCLRYPCEEGQACDPDAMTCYEPALECETCATARCDNGLVCVEIERQGPRCLTPCEGPGTCGDAASCVDGGCLPATGCGACELTWQDCVGGMEVYLDEVLCRCVACRGDSQCGGDQVCIDGTCSPP